MQIRRLTIIKDAIYFEGGLPAAEPVTRVAACAVIGNPLAGKAQDELDELLSWGADLGHYLVHEALRLLDKPAVSYGKAAIVGTSGDTEHAAAILHPRMGASIRAALGGGAAVIPSNLKIGTVGDTIDVPLGDKDDAWMFDRFDTFSVTVPNSPRPDEIVVIVTLADGGRPRPRVRRGQ